jgi:hypothetical protein
MTLPTNYTISCWVKRSSLSAGTFQHIYRFNGEDRLGFDTADLLRVNRRSGMDMLTAGRFRDTSAWYHFLVIASASDFQLFVNGAEHNYSDGGTYNRSGTGSTYGSDFQIGMLESASQFFDGYIAEFHLLDGIAVSDATDFGEVDETYGHWKPKEYEGSHGTNGFYLDFSTSANLGDDKSGSSNDFTATNLATSDQSLDSPTNNFCTMNSLNNDSSVTLSEGNLKFVNAGADQATASTMAVPSSGKFYWEVYVVGGSGAHINLGIVSAEQVGTLNMGDVGTFNAFASAGHRIYINSGYKAGSTAASTNTSYGAAWTTGDIIGVAVDMDTPSLTFYKNNVSQGVSHTDISLQTWIPLFASYSDVVTFVANFGQDGTFAGNKTAAGNSDANGYGNFFYAPPSGFLALCSKNLPSPTVVPSEHFNTVLYTGDGASSHPITGVGFKPDFLWQKNRS